MSDTIFKDWVFEHQQYKQSFDMLTEEIDRVFAGGSPFIFPLIGDSRVGKTALLCDVDSRYADKVSESGHRRVLYVSMPAAASNEALAIDIIKKILGNIPIKGTTSQILNQARGIMVRAGVLILMIDEVNHLIEKRSTQRAQTKANRNAADWLKELFDQAGISIVIAGLTHVIRMYNDNDQLENRGLKGAHIHPYAWGVRVDRKEFQDMVAAAVALFEEHGWHLDVEVDLLTRVTYLGGGGYIGKARDFLARVDEIGRRRKRLDRELLSRVYKGKYGFDDKGDPLELRTIDDVVLNGAHQAALQRAVRSGRGARQ